MTFTRGQRVIITQKGKSIEVDYWADCPENPSTYCLVLWKGAKPRRCPLRLVKPVDPVEPVDPVDAVDPNEPIPEEPKEPRGAQGAKISQTQNFKSNGSKRIARSCFSE